ncbi:MAG: hypothetical protein Q4E99_02505 [Bacillota bacterium]|nr:hypothetical protein [Bacillota bacterium]
MKKKFLSVMLTIVMLIGVVPVAFLPIFAGANVKAKVTVAAQAGGSFLVAPQEVEVAATLAEEYGYTDTVDSSTTVSALDILVKAHEIYYGEKVFQSSATNKLAVNDDGTITTLFGKDTSNCGFTVNGMCPNNGVESYGCYGGYSVNQE